MTRTAIAPCLVFFVVGCGAPPSSPPPPEARSAPAAQPVESPAVPAPSTPPPAAPSTPPPAAPPAQTVPVAPAPPPVAPPPTVVAVDAQGEPRFDPSLRGVERLGAGPENTRRQTALGAGWVDFDHEEDVSIVAELEHAGRTFVLLTGPPTADPSVRRLRSEPERVSVWLVELHDEVDPDTGEELFRRVRAVRLYDQAVPSTGDLDSAAYACSVESELRARDVDGDREVELTVLAAFIRPHEEPDEECGALGALVGVDDFGVQARFSREYHFFQTDAGGDVGEQRSCAWRFVDADHDGHADLHVVESWSYREDFEGDDIGEDESAPASHVRRSERRELDCLYVPADDVWRCDAAQPAPGEVLFAPDDSALWRHGERPW